MVKIDDTLERRPLLVAQENSNRNYWGTTSNEEVQPTHNGRLQARILI